MDTNNAYERVKKEYGGNVMAETYCGKNCGECAHKEALGCPGCENGPGRQQSGDCALAQCVRSKGHETCGACAFRNNCGTWVDRDGMPEKRRRKAEAQQRKKAALAQKTTVLRKWLWILFWLFIPGNIASLLTDETVVRLIPWLYLPGVIFSAALSVVYGVIFLLLSPVEDRYRTTGICRLIICGLNIFLGALALSAWYVVISIVILIVALVGDYNEYMAHSAVLAGVNDDLSHKWEILWKWDIGVLGGMFGGLILMLIFPILGALGILAMTIGMFVISIMKLIYLYRTAKCFREISV